MGADYPVSQEVIAEISALSPAAKQLINHHICNSLTVIDGAIQINRPDMANQQIDHIVEDLIMMGIRNKSFRRKG